MKKCPNCGTEIADNAMFCTECGKHIPRGNVCSYCGASVNNGDDFCQNCGKNLAGSSSVPNISTQESDEVESGSQSKFIMPVVVGLLILAIVCGGWWYYKSSKNATNNETQQEVTDSISVADVSDVETYSEKDIQEMKKFLEEFYGKMDSMGEIEESYIKENVTAKALRFLKENGYEYLTEYGNSVVLNTIKHIDANTFEVCINYYISPAWFDSTIRICVVKGNGSYKIDTIEKLESEISEGELTEEMNDADNPSDNPNAKYFGAWSLYINSEGQRLKVYTAIINSDMTCRFTTYLPDGSKINSINFNQCVFKDGYAFFTDNGNTNIKGTPRFLLGSNGLQSPDGINLVRE